MSILDLFRPAPPVEVAPTGEWPEESPEYYVAPPTYVIPEGAATPGEYLPTEDRLIPNRGDEHHGIVMDTSNMLIEPAPEDVIAEREALALADQDDYEPADTVMDPIPVQVVEMPVAQADEQSFNVTSRVMSIADGPQQICGRRFERKKVRIQTNDGKNVRIAPSLNELAQGEGWVVSGIAGIELDVTEAVYAAADSDDTTVRVLEEFVSRAEA